MQYLKIKIYYPRFESDFKKNFYKIYASSMRHHLNETFNSFIRTADKKSSPWKLRVMFQEYFFYKNYKNRCNICIICRKFLCYPFVPYCLKKCLFAKIMISFVKKQFR